LVRTLIDHGADIDISADEDGPTPAFNAARDDRLDILKILIACGADLKRRLPFMWETILHRTAETDNVQAAKMLLQSGADVNATDKILRTPLHEAKSKAMAQLLLDHGAKIDALKVDLGQPIHSAAWAVATEVVRYLISRGAGVDARDWDGRTPLHYVAESADDSETTNLLIESGADIEAQTYTHASEYPGVTPLHCAVLHLNFITLQTLIAAGANVNSEDAEGETPLDFIEGNVLYGDVPHDSYVSSQNIIEALRSAGGKTTASPNRERKTTYFAPQLERVPSAYDETNENPKARRTR